MPKPVQNAQRKQFPSEFDADTGRVLRCQRARLATFVQTRTATARDAAHFITNSYYAALHPRARLVRGETLLRWLARVTRAALMAHCRECRMGLHVESELRQDIEAEVLPNQWNEAL